jgi:MSHA biogenesis protein MshQ
VKSITKADSDPTNASVVHWTVTFSESVSGVNAFDFVLVPGGGVSGASITAVTGSGDTYTVTTNTGSGSGTLGLNLVDDDSISDAAGNKLGGTGAGNGNFTGEVYTIDKTAPTVTINQGATQTDPTSTAPITFTVVFSEAVSGFGNSSIAINGSVARIRPPATQAVPWPRTRTTAATTRPTRSR